MDLLTQLNGKNIPEHTKALQLINKLKSLVHQYDKNAEIILFGSRARGDWHEESDWDFLILTDLKDIRVFKDDLRNKISDEIEFVLNEVVFVIVKNKFDWENNHNVTPLFYNISEEGIRV